MRASEKNKKNKRVSPKVVGAVLTLITTGAIAFWSVRQPNSPKVERHDQESGSDRRVESSTIDGGPTARDEDPETALLKHLRTRSPSSHWKESAGLEDWVRLLEDLSSSCLEESAQRRPESSRIILDCQDPQLVTIALELFDIQRKAFASPEGSCSESLRRLRGTIFFFLGERRKEDEGNASRYALAVEEMQKWKQSVEQECAE